MNLCSRVLKASQRLYNHFTSFPRSVLLFVEGNIPLPFSFVLCSVLSQEMYSIFRLCSREEKSDQKEDLVQYR